jgi:alpha-tubulin suppressor-like RCC1 family protein
MNDGSVWCWGYNQSGQIGDGTTTERDSPVHVSALGNSVQAISAGYDRTCAIKTDGSLWCWGNTVGPSPVQIPTLGNAAAQVSVGFAHICVVKNDDTLWCWGWNGWGQLGDGTLIDHDTPEQVSPMVFGYQIYQVSAGYNHTCALKNDGTIWCFGGNTGGQLGNGTVGTTSGPVEADNPGASYFTSVKAGFYNSWALQNDDSLWKWGDTKEMDATGEPIPVNGLGGAAAAVSAGQDHTCARKKDGTLMCWGYNQDGELGNGTYVASNVPQQVTSLGSDVAEVSAGVDFTCARKKDGSLWCWGTNGVGQLGNGTTNGSFLPVQVSLMICGT